ncbi:MAG: response regulator [Caldilineaceae bacterium]
MVAAERAADLTRQLLAYARKGNFQLTLLDVSGLVRDTAGLFSAALPNRAELQLDLADALPAVTVDRHQLQQVVMNLVLNAAEALGNTGGYVRICTGMQLLVTSHEVSHYVGEALAPGAYVTLQVSDNGCGMEQTMLQQIFDPFFSTKSTGHGLGLAATLGIMRTHHGGIVVESQLGVGSTFTLLLPATTAQVPTPQSVAATTTHHYCSPPTLLVIDDEVAIREAVTDLLTTAGITILTAASGQEGIDLFRRQGDQIDLILLDMKMPQLSGEETLRALCQIDPTVNVILSSGYTETEIHHLQQEANVVAFLPKPYNFAQLTAAIHDALHHLASVAPVEAAE